MKFERILATIVAIVAIAIAGFAIGEFAWWWVGAIAAAALLSAFAQNALMDIPTKHRGVLTLLGRRVTGVELKEGLTFLPLQPWIFGVETVSMQTANVDIENIEVNCRDGSRFYIKASFSLKALAGQLIDLQNNGGIAGVVNRFEDRIVESVREYAANNIASWTDAIRVRQAILMAIVPEICGMETATPDEIRREVQALRGGRGSHALDGLGVALVQFSVPTVEPEDSIQEAADRAVAAKKEGEAAIIVAQAKAKADEIAAQQLAANANTTNAKVEEIVAKLVANGVSREAALKAALVQLKAIEWKARDNAYSVDTNTIAALAEGFKKTRRP